jgi:hypothetical protein
MTSSLLRFLVIPASVAFSTRCDQCDEVVQEMETTAQLQWLGERTSLSLENHDFMMIYCGFHGIEWFLNVI